MLSEKALQQNAAGFDERQLKIIQTFIDYEFEHNKPVHPKTLFKSVKEAIDFTEFNDFYSVLSACVKTGRILNCHVGKAGIIHPGTKIDSKKKSFTEEDIVTINNATVDLLKENEPRSRQEIYDVVKDEIKLEYSDFNREFTNAYSEGLFPAIVSKRGPSSGVYLKETEEALKKQKEEGAFNKPYLSAPKKEIVLPKIKPPKLDLFIGDKHYDVPLTEADIKTLILRVLDGVESEDGIVKFGDKKYKCDEKLLDKFLFYYFESAVHIEKENDEIVSTENEDKDISDSIPDNILVPTDERIKSVISDIARKKKS